MHHRFSKLILIKHSLHFKMNFIGTSKISIRDYLKSDTLVKNEAKGRQNRITNFFQAEVYFKEVHTNCKIM